jgi:hypothetical protein
VFWSFAQKNLRAAHHARRTEGVYTLYCSNYSCGPDSFSLHFYAYLMEGKPFAVIETDGHSGDAGTKTRVEAFLHCVAEDRAAAGARQARDLKATTETAVIGTSAARRDHPHPRMGPRGPRRSRRRCAAWDPRGVAADARPRDDAHGRRPHLRQGVRADDG